MTTIAYRDGVLAADTQSNRSGMRTRAQKLFRVGEHIMGGAGTYVDVLAFVRWWPQREEKPLKILQFRGANDPPDLEMIVLGPDGVHRWTEYQQPAVVLDEFCAIGTGAMAATAAMHMGASAIEAVRIASLVDILTGGEIESACLAAPPIGCG